MDGNRTNNQAANLKWKKIKRQGRAAVRPGRTAVWQLDSLTGRRIAIYRCKRVAAKHVGGYQAGITNCLAGKKRTAGGYRWEWATRNDEEAHLACGDK